MQPSAISLTSFSSTSPYTPLDIVVLCEETQTPGYRAHRSLLKSEHLMERARAGTLIEWPTEYCPSCGHGGFRRPSPFYIDVLICA